MRSTKQEQAQTHLVKSVSAERVQGAADDQSSRLNVVCSHVERLSAQPVIDHRRPVDTEDAFGRIYPIVY